MNSAEYTQPFRVDEVAYEQLCHNQWCTDHYTRTNISHMQMEDSSEDSRITGPEPGDIEAENAQYAKGSPTYGELTQAHEYNMEIVDGPFDSHAHAVAEAERIAEAENCDVADPSQIYHWNAPLPEPDWPQHLDEPEEPHWGNPHWGAPDRRSQDALEAIFVGVTLKERAAICGAYARYCRALSKAQMPFKKRK